MIQGFLIKAIANLGSLKVALDQSRILQYLKMLAYGGLGQGEPVHDLAADTLFHPHEVPHNGNPDRVAQGFAHLGQGLVRMAGLAATIRILLHR